MPLPHMAEAKAWTEQMCSGAFQFQIPAQASTTNYQVRASVLPASNIGTSQLTPTYTFSPVNARVEVYCSPNGSLPGATGNPNPMPRGVASGSVLAGSEFLVDLSGFPGDIVNATANYIGTSRTASPLAATVSCIDNVNKLVYVQIVNTTTGVANIGSPGNLIAVQIVFQDSYAV